MLGLDAAHAAYIVGRIVTIARELRIPVSSGRCPSNVVIVVAGNADEFIQLLVDRHPRLFRSPRDNLATRAEIAQLLRPRPIRWIAASSTGNADGTPIVAGVNRLYSATRITAGTRENATLSFIVVDAGRLDNIVWSQLTDYLTLVALGRPAMEADYDAATVMSIFQIRDRGGQGPRWLTSQDRALLRALYSTNPAASAEAQRAAIRRRVARGDGSTEAE